MKLIAAAIFAAAALSGCAKATAPYEIFLDEARSFGSVAKGGFVSISLNSNPTTGYLWTVSVDGTPQLQFIKEQYAGTDPKLAGSGGTTVFKFAAIRRGRTKVELKYGRSWELTFIKTASFTVDVQ